MIIAAWMLKDYFIPRIQIIMGIIAAPFVFKIKEKGVFSFRYAYATIIFTLAFYFLHVYVLLFLALGCLLFFTVESRVGKIGLLPFLFLVCISPAMHYAVNVFTFSIRLALSEYAAIMLNIIGIKVANHGNYFVQPDGSSFSVDTACIGLNMFNTGLCLVVLMIGFAEQKIKKNMNFISLSGAFIIAIVLLIVTNLLRIVGLVFFRSMPGTMSHDVIGILSLVVYMAIPMYFLVRFLVKKFGTTVEEKQVTGEAPFKKTIIASAMLCSGLILADYLVNDFKEKNLKDEKLSHLNLPGFTKTLKDDGVMEYRKDSILIYIKPANKAYESDHPPNMCWQGSGFQLKEISEFKCAGYTIFTATLKKETLTQYTAWWYDNGKSKTISQWEWRLSKGEPFRTINITTTNKQELEMLCNDYLKQKLF